MNTIRVCTVGRDGARRAACGKVNWPIWTGKVYEARRRKSDGVWTWRLVDTFGGTRAGVGPSRRFTDELREGAPAPWLEATHGGRVPEKLAAAAEALAELGAA